MFISRAYKFLLLAFALINAVCSEKTEFNIYWNVPTMQCHKHGFNFTNIPQYGIKQNANDKFKGEKITILYDPGYFPAMLGTTHRNGGVPQLGNINKHLAKFKNDLISAIPNTEFEGIGIIDFERWRPIYRENWGTLDIYRILSREIEKKQHPNFNKTQIDKQAKQNFEKSAFLFMDRTLSLATKLRPKARWGYYAFPYCFNFTPKNFRQECTDEVIVDNDQSTWMYRSGTAVLPSVYLQQKVLNEAKREKLIEYRVLEGVRISKKASPKLKLFTYVHYKYTDTGAFLSQSDMRSSLLKPLKTGADGVIIWGSSKDVNTAKKCEQLNHYVDRVIGPIVKSMNLENFQLKNQNETA